MEDKPDTGVVSDNKQEDEPTEIVYLNARDSDNNSDGKEKPIEETPVSRYPTRSRSSPNRLNPTMTGERRGNSLEGVIYSQVQSISVEYDEDKGGEDFVRSEGKKFKLTGAGYRTKKIECSACSAEQVGHSTKQGVINLNFGDSAPPPAQMTK